MPIFLPGFETDLFAEFEQMRRQLDRLFGDWGLSSGIRTLAAGGWPAVNVGASPKQVDVYLFAPGLDPAKLDVSIQQNVLTVAGERTTEVPESAQVYRRERFSGTFRRSIVLPEDVDPDKVTAVYRDGVLRITVERRAEVQPRRIEVK
ncbi:MAG: heat-shock protein Hsp20 [Porticoccaceae bacterium]|nr:MAG: heat-shock protein Hsp20 [Porticoccaceae bacterium]